MTHVDHAINGTVDLAKSLLEQINDGKSIDIQVAKTAVRARLVQILSLMSMDVAPSPWVTKKRIAQELKESFDNAHSKEEILEALRQTSERLK